MQRKLTIPVAYGKNQPHHPDCSDAVRNSRAPQWTATGWVAEAWEIKRAAKGKATARRLVAVTLVQPAQTDQPAPPEPLGLVALQAAVQLAPAAPLKVAKVPGAMAPAAAEALAQAEARGTTAAEALGPMGRALEPAILAMARGWGMLAKVLVEVISAEER